ncbi:MAG: ImmA/IrrE family metallo-endopeptidase [Bacteroidia bacterium]
MALGEYPAAKLAKKLFKKYGLKIPFDLKELVREHATLLYKSIPIEGVDGLSLNIKVIGATPTVIINEDIPKTRQLFTLAHELGHLIIPWHCGIGIEGVGIRSRMLREMDYREMEQEANIFAAELLMPQELIMEMYQKTETLAKLHKSICATMGVSEHAAAIRMGELLPENILFLAESDGEISYSGQTRDTYASIPEAGFVEPDELFHDAVEHTINKARSTNIHWWRIPLKKAKKIINDERDWREILDLIVEDLIFDEDDQKRFKSTINGKIAYVNGKEKVKEHFSKETLYSACYYRLSDTVGLEPLVAHKDFPAFLKKKIDALFDSKK